MNIFLKAYNNKLVLSVHALIVFTIFFLVDENIKLRVLACSFEITYFKNLPVTHFKDPIVPILTLKMLTGRHL
jgi:hypothetical protein